MLGIKIKEDGKTGIAISLFPLLSIPDFVANR